jgi:hypothetical protein
MHICEEKQDIPQMMLFASTNESEIGVDLLPTVGLKGS